MKIQDIPSHTLLTDTPDLESRLPTDEQSALRIWLRLLSCSTLIEKELRSRLRREFNTTLPPFELMAQLVQRPRGMKMTELSQYMLVTNGNITGITDQLEKEGYVKRQRQAHDQIGRASCREREEETEETREVKSKKECAEANQVGA